MLCFVEVKAKSSFDFGLPEEAVTLRKQKKLQAAAFSYIESKGLKSRAMRFDVFLRPTESEGVLLQFGDIAVYDGREVSAWWPTFRIHA